MDARTKQERMNFDRFESLIAAPGNLVTGITLPAGAKLYVSSTSALAAVTPMISANATDVNVPATATVGLQQSVGYHSKDRLIKKAVGAVGTVSLYVQNGLGTLFKIAQG